MQLSVWKQYDYYVYTLAYPESMGGQIFYVGKGQQYTDQFDRIDDHERQALGQRHYNNPRKVEIIREIQARGEQVVKRKVAFFADEQDALMYEWALIHMTCFATTLANKTTVGPRLPVKPLPELPPIEKPICIQGPGYTIHRVTDLEQFLTRYHMKRTTMLRLLQTGDTHKWKLINCPCEQESVRPSNKPDNTRSPRTPQFLLRW